MRSVLVLGIATSLTVAVPTRAVAATTQQEALAEAFPGMRIERRPFLLSDAQVHAVEKAAKARLGTRLITAYLGWRGDTLAGTAFLDTRVVRTMPAVLMVVIAPDTTVARLDVLAFHEPPDYLPGPRWLGLFGGRRLDDQLWPGRSIRNLSGATLTTRAFTVSARLALACYRELVAPTVARR